MVEQTPVFKESFINHYQDEFPPFLPFLVDRNGRVIEGTSNHDFRFSRTDLMTCYLNQEPKHPEMTQALLAEELVVIAIGKPLLQKNFYTYLAPQNLESGMIHKGVDIIIADQSKMVCLGIDVKLKKGRSKHFRDGFGWSANLESPYVYLKLGNWSLNTREQLGVKVRDWIDTYTLPKINQNGKIPRIFEMRQYIFGRISNTLSSYLDLMDHPDGDLANITIPADPVKSSLLREKVTKLKQAFLELDSYYNGP